MSSRSVLGFGISRVLCPAAAMTAIASSACAGTVAFVPFYQDGSAWVDATNGAAYQAAAASMLDQFAATLQTSGNWNASIEVFFKEDGTSAFASTSSANNAAVTHNGSTYQGTGTWREIVQGTSDNNGTTVNLTTGAGSETEIDWNFSLSSPNTNLGLLRHELMHSFGMTSFLGNEMPTMAPDGTITKHNVGGTTSATVYDSRIVDLNFNLLLGNSQGGISYTVNDYAVDNDWSDANGSGLVFHGIADDGSAMYFDLTSFNPAPGSDRTVQASHPREVSYASSHPTWNTLVEVDRAFLRGMGYSLTMDQLLGDLDGDGHVGAGDLDILFANWGSASASPLTGDVNGDGTVALNDLNIVLAAWGEGTPPSGLVPEPGTLSLLALGGIVLVRRRRR